MKRIIFIMAAALSLVACNQNTPDDTKKGGDTPTSQHQPANPSTWSPVGHKYVSTDEDPVYGHYGAEIIFLSRDTFYWNKNNIERNRKYRLEYPLIYIEDSNSPWLKFIDTLTISKYASMADESSRYELVY